MIEVIVESAFAEIAALLVMAAVIGFLGIILRQPLIVSFIAVGLIAGPRHSTLYGPMIRLVCFLSLA